MCLIDACEASALDHTLFVCIVRDIKGCLCLIVVWIPPHPPHISPCSRLD
jgi:hypothetical protein